MARAISTNRSWDIPALDRFFNLAALGTTKKKEIIAGLTTFVVMSYIIFVNPSILGSTQSEVSRAELITSTCLVAGFMSIIMGLATNKAYAIAPGMGLNAIVAFSLVAGEGLTYGQAMGVIVAEGILITLLVLTNVRQMVMDAIPVDLRKAIAMGIGLFILLIGLVSAGIVTAGAGTPVALNPNAGWQVVIALVGIVLTLGLYSRGNKAALLIGILATTVVAIIVNEWHGGDLWVSGVAEMPNDWVGTPEFGGLGHFSFGFFGELGRLAAVVTVISLGMSDFFDTMGTMLGVGSRAGYVDPNGRIPGTKRLLLVDSLSAVAGGASGASSATTYIESSAGVEAGGRSGLTPVVVGLCFLLSIPLWPLIGIVPPQATAAALIIVGVLMVVHVIGEIDFTKFEVALPVLATMLMMPFTYSITNGIGAGFLTYVAVKLFQGEGRRLHPILYGLALIFVFYFFREWFTGVEA